MRHEISDVSQPHLVLMSANHTVRMAQCKAMSKRMSSQIRLHWSVVQTFQHYCVTHPLGPGVVEVFMTEVNRFIPSSPKYSAKPDTF